MVLMASTLSRRLCAILQSTSKDLYFCLGPTFNEGWVMISIILRMPPLGVESKDFFFDVNYLSHINGDVLRYGASFLAYSYRAARSRELG